MKSFSNYLQKDNNSILLVDTLNLAFRWKHKGQSDFTEDLINTIKSLAKSYKTENIIITADQGSSSYRKEIDSQYKGNREELRKNQTEEEKEFFKEFIEGFNTTLFALEQEGYLVLKYPRVEADDLIAYIVKNRRKFSFENIWIISSDGDLDQLLSKNVSRFSYITRKEHTIENWKYSFDVEEFITYKCLTGDKGDNVPGIDKIGPKRAESIINQYGSLFDIIESLPLEGTQKFIQNLNQGKERLETNFELMDLFNFCEEAIGEENLEDLNRSILNVRSNY